MTDLRYESSLESYPPELWGAGIEPVGPVALPATVPDESWTKTEIVAWLDQHGDPASGSLTKSELLEHVANILDDEVDDA